MNEVALIPIKKIRILNPRSRNQHKFEQIVGSIASLGLKKPITVSRRREEPDCDDYDLVCGQGRLEAYKVLGREEILAMVIDVCKEDRLMMSLVENLARKNHSHFELLQSIKILKERGYTTGEIAEKTGLSADYASGIIRLLEQGEERLIQAVESRHIPLSVALDIAKSESGDIQKVLMDAYENNDLKGRALHHAQRLIKQREAFGKMTRNGYQRAAHNKPVTANALVKILKLETKKQQLTIEKAERCKTRLLFMVEGLKALMRDENFVNLLRAEKLDTVPPYLKEQIEGAG